MGVLFARLDTFATSDLVGFPQVSVDVDDLLRAKGVLLPHSDEFGLVFMRIRARYHQRHSMGAVMRVLSLPSRIETFIHSIILITP